MLDELYEVQRLLLKAINNAESVLDIDVLCQQAMITVDKLIDNLEVNHD